MNRYTIKTEVTETQDEMRMQLHRKALSLIVDDPEGEWVRWSDVEKLREHLEGQIPEKRIERLEKALGLVHEGKCPECQRPVRGWQAPLGSFAPEAFATLREMGVDPTTGHMQNCSLNRK